MEMNFLAVRYPWTYVQPLTNVKFRGAAVNRPRNWPRSGIGASRRSPAKFERQQISLNRVLAARR